jgi:V8-like Glu-specific endopeptidase
VAIFQAASVNDNGDGTSTLNTENFGDSNDLCQTERFRDQPIGAFCSGFLVAPDIVATAGHCVNANTLGSCRFVFGFYMESAASARLTISNQEIYRGIELLGRQELGTGPDWSVVRLDRPVTNHRVVSVRREGKIADGQAVHVIGHPCGLPQKFAGGAAVRSNERRVFLSLIAHVRGNSGSPVLTAQPTRSRESWSGGRLILLSRGTAPYPLYALQPAAAGKTVRGRPNSRH